MSIERDEITSLVRKVVTRTMGQYRRRPVINEESVRLMPTGSMQVIPADAIITPLASQIAIERRIEFVKDGTSSSASTANNPSVQTSEKRTIASGQKVVALGADHGGYELKERLKAIVAEAGYGVIDCGTHSADSVDYPDFAYAVARMVADSRAWRGIIVDGAGIGSCMAANKVPGIRAAMCYDQATAVNSREHNNANVLTLGAGLIGPSLAGQIVQTWLATGFGGGRHGRRVDKIDAIGERYQKGKGSGTRD
jgi:ribose 5-phosphate isomerase B